MQFIAVMDERTHTTRSQLLPVSDHHLTRRLLSKLRALDPVSGSWDLQGSCVDFRHDPCLTMWVANLQVMADPDGVACSRGQGTTVGQAGMSSEEHRFWFSKSWEDGKPLRWCRSMPTWPQATWPLTQKRSSFGQVPQRKKKRRWSERRSFLILKEFLVAHP